MFTEFVPKLFLFNNTGEYITSLMVKQNYRVEFDFMILSKRE